MITYKCTIFLSLLCNSELKNAPQEAKDTYNYKKSDPLYVITEKAHQQEAGSYKQIFNLSRSLFRKDINLQ